MLDTLKKLPPDSILGLAAACREDPNPRKVDLTVGIYMNEEGICPVFGAIAEAQRQLVAEETTKAYLPPAGTPEFNRGMQRLVLGRDSEALASGRVGSIQTPGGCGALSIGAGIIQAAQPGATVWVTDPTWANHVPLLSGVGLQIKPFRYYDADSHGVDFEAMVEDLKKAGKKDVVLLHGCCHNPCGADLSPEQWQTVAEMAEKQGFTPFVDIAYQGLGDGLEADAAGVRLLVSRLPEVLIAASCSKNMGLYRERTGAAIFACKNSDNARAIESQAAVAARRIYSMPPAHGALLAARVLEDETLNGQWHGELAAMCERINSLRSAFVEKLNAATDRDFGFIREEKGMFSFLGLTPEQAQQLRNEHSVYMLDSSRINVAGLNARNIDYVVESVAGVLKQSA